METFIFYVLATVVIVPAILVVSLKNVFHSALFLIVSLLGVGGFYAMLAADFLFGIQLLVYAGGIMVILLFVIFLSGKPSDWAGAQVNEKAWAAGLFSVFFVAVVASMVYGWKLMTVKSDPQLTTSALGKLLLGEMLLPMELISLVLVAALVGAVYFSTRRSR